MADATTSTLANMCNAMLTTMTCTTFSSMRYSTRMSTCVPCDVQHRGLHAALREVAHKAQHAPGLYLQHHVQHRAPPKLVHVAEYNVQHSALLSDDHSLIMTALPRAQQDFSACHNALRAGSPNAHHLFLAPGNTQHDFHTNPGHTHTTKGARPGST